LITHIHHELPKLARKTGPDGSRVYETPSGLAYPSVTSVTGLHGKQAIMEWRKRVGDEEANRISSRAAKRGTRIHSLCEDFLYNKEVVPDIFDHDLWKSFSPLLHNIDNVHALETPLYSDHLQVAGTVDCVAEYKGKLAVIDFKTSSRVKLREDIHSYFMQCAAYAVAFEERTGVPVPRLVVLMAVDNEEPLVFEEKRDDWIGKFLWLREEFRQWKNY
jgi:ATP-dependent exoDNAse (exonuclease V) beta subunit